MAVQITGRQIANSAIGVAKLILSTGSYDFSSGDAVLSANDPTADAHVATKSYVDSVAQGLNWKESVRAATTANITLSGTQTVDGVSLVADDRILVKNQSDAKQNGIYVVASGSWSRSSDMNEGTEFSGAAVFIQEGTANADTGYVCTNNGDVTVGSDSIAFTQFTGAGQLSAGNGIDITNSTISVDLDGATLSSSGSGLKVSDAGIDTTQLADGAVETAKIADAQITTAKIAGDAIDASKISDSAVRREHLNSDVVNAAGAIGLDPTNNDLLVIVDDSTIEITGSNDIAVKDGGISTAKIADSAVTNAKLAGSITAEKLQKGTALTDNAGNLELASSVAGNGIDLTSQVLSVDLDGATLSVSASGVKVSDAGIGTSQLAADCITNAKIADDAVQTENLNFAGFFSKFTADGSSSSFELAAALDLEFKEFFVVAVNGLLMDYNASTSTQDEYYIDNGGTGGVGRIVFGSNLANGDKVSIRGFINN